MVSGLVKMPIIIGIDVLDKTGINITSKRSFTPTVVPLSIFEKKCTFHGNINFHYVSISDVEKNYLSLKDIFAFVVAFVLFFRLQQITDPQDMKKNMVHYGFPMKKCELIL